jgi:protein-histidine pros-kinase
MEYIESQKTLLMRAGIGWGDGVVGVACAPISRDDQAGYCFLMQRRVIVDDYGPDTPFRPAEILKNHAIVSGLTVHIPGQENPLGVLGAFGSSRRTFSHDDVNFMRAIANVVAAAMQRRRNEETIRRSESYFRGLLESAPDGMAIVDSEGKMLLVNKETERLFGYERSALLGQKIEMLVPERYRSYHNQHRGDYFTDPHPRPMGVGLELFGRRRDGSEFPVEISLSPMSTPEGVVVTAAIRDVSERAKAEAQIKKLNAQLEEALRRSERLAATGRLVASIAHEIANPLESIRDCCALLKQEKLTPRQQEILQVAQQELERLANVARQTLAPHREPGAPLVVKASELLEAACEPFLSKLARNHIQVERDFDPDAAIKVFPAELRQVFTNLITNAIDAMPSGGWLKLTVRRRDHDVVEIEVRDTGSGIGADELPRIFEPFFTTKGEKGLGIGLWLSRNIVERFGGTISATSSTSPPDKGTCFSIPLAAAVPKEEHNRKKAA